MFWSLVRPDKILLPITRSAAVTTSLEADELAVGMITCEMFKGQESWNSTPDQRRASALRMAGCFIGLLWAGGGSKKKKVRIGRARRRRSLVTWRKFYSQAKNLWPPTSPWGCGGIRCVFRGFLG